MHAAQTRRFNGSTWIKVTLAVFLSFVVACQPKVLPQGADESDVSVRNGTEIAETEFPAVVWIGGCTATFVSHNTLLTAAHCVGNRNRTTGLVAGQIRLPKNGNATSLKVYANPKHGSQFDSRGNRIEVDENDLVVAIFPDNTAPATMPIHLQRTKIGDTFTIVGYGGYIWSPPRGSPTTKRKGTNRILSFADDMINSTGFTGPKSAGADGTNVSVAPGDSGGPLFIDGELAGIASGGGPADGTSVHSSLQYQENINFLKKMVAEQGAIIPGVELLGLGTGPNTGSGAGSGGNPGSGSNPGAGGNAGSGPIPQIAALPDIYVGIADGSNERSGVYNLEVSVADFNTAVLICPNVNNAAQCTLQSPGALLVTEARTLSGRKFFRTPQAVDLSQGKSVTIVAMMSPTQNGASRVLTTQ